MTTTGHDDAALRLVAGRARAVELFPYLGTAMYAMTPRRSVGKGLKTAGVDKRWRMYYNPDFIRTLTVNQCAGLWLHEIGHPLHQHRERFEALGEPDERWRLFNCAGDAAINDVNKQAGVELIPGYDWQYDRIPGAERNMITEQFYRLLLDTPEADKVSRQKVELLLNPSALRYDYGSGQRISGLTRRRMLDDTATVAIIDADGNPVPGAVGPVRVHDKRTLDFVLDTVLDPGTYAVQVTCGDRTIAAALDIITPTIRLRPDHVTRGYTAPFHMVIEGTNTRFATAPTTVKVLMAETTTAADGSETVNWVPTEGAVLSSTTVSDEYVNFELASIPDGIYQVVTTTGTEVCTAYLPVGMPHLTLSPESLPSGHGSPYPIAVVADDFTFDKTSTIEIRQMVPFVGWVPMPGGLTSLVVKSATTADFAVAQPLADGPYLIVATTGSEEAVTVLSVGDGGGEGEGGEGGSGGGSGSGKGKGGDGDGEGDEDDDFPDCGSAAGGGRRPWEDADNDNDGSVDEARGDAIRRETAKEIERASRSRGDIPGGWLRWAKEINDPAVDWREELNAVVRRVLAEVAGQDDYTFRRPAREADATPDFVLPGTGAWRPPMVRGIVDTSGSMADGDLGRCLSEIQGLIDEVTNGGGQPLEVIACDASASDWQEINSVEGIDLSGGGGTDMRIGIQAAAERRPLADLIITLTDGETPWPDAPPAENPEAVYVAVLVRGEASYSEVPDWMHKIVIQDGVHANA